MRRLLFMFLFAPTVSFGLVVAPTSVLQGEPVRVRTEGAVSSVHIDSKPVPYSVRGTTTEAFIGFPIDAKVGVHEVMVKFSNDTHATTSVTVLPRERIVESFSVPKKLGGNTAKSVTRVVSDLEKENAILMGLKTTSMTLWSLPFQYPVATPIVTDTYGYTRDTSGVAITHKGTDFRAKKGTSVLAMNRGVVRLVRTSRVYGKTVVVDHGQGVFTYYMHLSKVSVNQGQRVQKGQILGKSGDTGYALKPHLHVSVRVGGASVDPIAFLKLFEDN